MVVVNCAGRTRSIIGAQSLINAGLPNPVAALRNGTMGWTLAGLRCDSGATRRAPAPSPHALGWAKAAAERVAQRFDIARIDMETLARFQAEQEERTLYLLDVRDPMEYAAGHLPGASSAPGGQLVQATDQYVGTLGARIVLVDEAEARAVMTASWLKQMGWKEVFVLAASGTATAPPAPAVLGSGPTELRIGCAALAELVTAKRAIIVDLSLSREYLKAHIPGAWFAIRSRLARALARIPLDGMLVLTSEDGVLAGLAAPEAQGLTGMPVRFLAGGNAAWQTAGHTLTADDPRMADEAIDVWLKPYERPGDAAKAMSEYLAWEVDLLAPIGQDGSTSFVRPAS
jgi:rhodanese-related sulfurtransferase